MVNKKKEKNHVDKYRSNYKKRRGFHGYKPEKITTTTQSESMHVQDGEEIKFSLKKMKQSLMLLREDESNKLCRAILQVETGLTVADEIVDEGSKQLKELLTKKNASRKDLQD